jgi:hypothetical protein
MSGVSRNSKKFYSVRPCQLYDLNTNVRLMIMKNQKQGSDITAEEIEEEDICFKCLVCLELGKE